MLLMLCMRDLLRHAEASNGCSIASNYKVVLGVVVGAALGAAAMQGLHAQAKPKAYTISELETLDAAGLVAFVPAIEAAQKAAGSVAHPEGRILVRVTAHRESRAS
jgi:hypothetical protein